MCLLPGSLQQKCFTIKFHILPVSPFFIWLPGLVGASNGVSHIQGMVGTLLGFAAGVSGAPGVMGVMGAMDVSGAAGVLGVAGVSVVANRCCHACCMRC